MDRVEAILEKQNIRITPMRQMLLEYYLENESAFGLLELENAFPNSDRITIYRTLKTFEEKGVVHSINSGSGEVKYALCNEYCNSTVHIDEHPHFQCERCNRVTCIDSALIPKVDLPEGFLQKESSMMIKGICSECQP